MKELPEEEQKWLNDILYTDKDIEHLKNGKQPVYDIKKQEEFLKSLEKKGVKLSDKQKENYLKRFEVIKQ